MKAKLTIICVMSAICAVSAAQKPTAKKTSFSESELRALAKAVPDVKNAGQLYSVALATSNDADRQQAYLKASAAGLIACGKTDIYKKHIKGKLQNVAEFEDGLKDDCEKCSGAGTKERRCYDCKGEGKCPGCKGSGETVRVGFNVGFNNNNETKPCRKCKGSGRCPKCGGEGSTMEKCFACAGTGKVFSKSVAARVFRNSCNAIADGTGMMVKPEVAAGPEEEKEERKDVAESRTTRRRRRGPEPEERNGTEQGDVKEVSIAENSDVSKGCQSNIEIGKEFYQQGMKFYNGEGVLQNYDRAFKCFSEASRLGCLSADAMLSYMYSSGKGCKEDSGKSFSLAKRAMSCDDKFASDIAKFTLGTLYLFGFVDASGQSQQNNYKAYQYINEAIVNSGSVYLLGLMEYHGVGTTKNAEKAAKCFAALRDAEDALLRGEAFMCAGQLLYKGDGVTKNQVLAWKLLRIGAQTAFPELIRAAKAPLTDYDIADFNNHFGNQIALWTPFSWKMYNLYKGKHKFKCGGVQIDLLEQALRTLFNPDCWLLSGIEYNFDDM